MTKKSKSKSSKNTLSPLAQFMSDAVDATEKSLQLVNTTGDQLKISTGILVYDLINGGGVGAGMYTTSGPEQSAKSTVGISVLNSAVKAKIPVIMYFNAEGTLDPDYTARLFGVKSLAGLLGERDNNGNWIIKPKIRYYTENVLETVYKTIQRTLNALPDKVYRQERKNWYLVFERTKVGIAAMKSMGLNYDPKLYTKTGMYYCEAPDDKLQAIIMIDSYPSLVTRAIMEEESEGNGMAVDALAYSKWVKRVNGLLKAKAATIWGINQVRLNPGERFGNPEYEPCGNALKFYSTNRCRVNKRAVSGVKVGDGAWSENEKSIIKGEDTYHYKHIKNIKNKGGTSNLEGWMRIWVDNGKGKGFGIDPVFDTYAYLVMTGQLVGSRKKGFNIVFKSSVDDDPKINRKELYSWELFKRTILAETGLLEVKTKEKFKSDIRATCFKQLKSGLATQLFAFARNNDESGDLEDSDL